MFIVKCFCQVFFFVISKTFFTFCYLQSFKLLLLSPIHTSTPLMISALPSFFIFNQKSSQFARLCRLIGFNKTKVNNEVRNIEIFMWNLEKFEKFIWSGRHQPIQLWRYYAPFLCLFFLIYETHKQMTISQAIPGDYIDK